MAQMMRLFEEARMTGKWFWSRYLGIWFSPEELERAQRNGKFRWGPDNWELRDPDEEVQRLAQAVVQAKKALKDFQDRLERHWRVDLCNKTRYNP